MTSTRGRSSKPSATASFLPSFLSATTCSLASTHSLTDTLSPLEASGRCVGWASKPACLPTAFAEWAYEREREREREREAGKANEASDQDDANQERCVRSFVRPTRQLQSRGPGSSRPCRKRGGGGGGGFRKEGRKEGREVNIRKTIFVLAMRIGKPVRASRSRSASNAAASSSSNAENNAAKEGAEGTEAAAAPDGDDDGVEASELRRTTRKRTKTKLYGGEEENKKRSSRLADKTKEEDIPPQAEEEQQPAEPVPDPPLPRKITRASEASASSTKSSTAVAPPPPPPVELSYSNLNKWLRMKEELQVTRDDALFEYLRSLHVNRRKSKQQQGHKSDAG